MHNSFLKCVWNLCGCNLKTYWVYSVYTYNYTFSSHFRYILKSTTVIIIEARVVFFFRQIGKHAKLGAHSFYNNSNKKKKIFVIFRHIRRALVC